MNLSDAQFVSSRPVGGLGFCPPAARCFFLDSKASTDALQLTTSTQGANSPGVSLSKSQNAIVGLGTAPVVRTGNNASVTFTDGGAIAALQDVAKQALTNNSTQTAALFDQIDYSLSQNAQAAQQANNAATTLLQQSLSSQSDLAKSNATGGQSDTNKLILYVAVIIAAVVAFIKWKK